MKKTLVYGAGGFGSEVMEMMLSSHPSHCYVNFEDCHQYVVDDDYFTTDENHDGYRISPLSFFEGKAKDIDAIFLAVGDPSAREEMFKMASLTLCHNVPGGLSVFKNLIAPTAIIEPPESIGSIFCNYVVVTKNVFIGNFAILNLHVSIGHDCLIEPFFTAAPGARVSGHCHIGRKVYLGTNACVREGISICDNVTIGMGGVVVKDITEPGVYVGNPVKKIK